MSCDVSYDHGYIPLHCPKNKIKQNKKQDQIKKKIDKNQNKI